MSNVTSENRIRKETSKSNIEISRVYKGDYQKEGTLTAELKQTVTTISHYPSKSVSNDHQDNIFSMSDFDFEETTYENKETRVAWLDVPEGSSVESVKAQLDKYPEAELYKVLSNRPIITDAQQYAIQEGLTNLDAFANRQAVRYPDGHESSGELALDTNGKVQYRAVFFKSEAKEDQDLRNADMEDMYLSPELAAEMNDIGAEVIASQSL